MRFNEIGDSDESDSSLTLPATYATGIAERMKARTSKKKLQDQETQLNADERDLLDFEEETSQPAGKRVQQTSKRKGQIEPVEEDDLTMNHNQDLATPPITTSSGRKRNSKTKRALDEYQAPRLEDSASKRKSKRSKVKQVVYAEVCDAEGNLKPQASHVDATPGLPEPISHSKSHLEAARLSKKPPKGTIKDSQSSPIVIAEDSPVEIRHKESAAKGFSVLVPPNADDQQNDPGEDCPRKQPPELLDEEDDETVKVPVPRSRRKIVMDEEMDDDVPANQAEAILTPGEKVSDTEDTPKPPNRRTKQKEIVKKTAATKKKTKQAKKPLLSPETIESEDESQANATLVALTDSVSSLPQTPLPGSTRQKISAEKAAEILRLKEEFSKSKACQEVVPKEEESVGSPSTWPNVVEKKQESPEPKKLVEIKPEQPKVPNYAALVGKSPSIKLTSGPRHRVGLSRKLKVEPLHANFVRK